MIRALPLIIGIVPIVGVTVAYWLNVKAGVLPSCIPYLDGCTSISSTGRYLPGSVPFRAALLPQAALLAYFWWFSVTWLKQVAPAYRGRNKVVICGIVGAAALVLYVSFLGTKQPFYEFMRRFGIYFYFLGTALAQILLARAMPRSTLRTAMLWVIAAPFGLGLWHLFLRAVLDDTSNIENRVEWIGALLMQTWFVLFYFAWRKSVPVVTRQTDSPSAR